MRFFAVVLAVAMLSGASAGAKTVDLSAFDGNYKGKSTILAGGSVYQAQRKGEGHGREDRKIGPIGPLGSHSGGR